MVQHSNNVFELSLYKPFTFILKIFSLKCDEEETKNGVSLWFLKVLITAIFFFCVQTYCFYIYYIIFVNENYPFYNVYYVEITQTLFSHVQYNVDLFFVYKYGRHTKFEYLKCFKNIDNIVGFSNIINLDVKYCIKLYFLSFFVAWFISCGIDLAAWASSYGISAILYAPFYFYSLIKMITLLDFILQILLLECCLKTVSDILQRHQNNYYSKNKVIYWLDSSIKSVKKTRLDRLKILDSALNEEVLQLKNSYLLLLQQSSYINKMYGFRILLNCASLILDMVYFATLAYHCINGTFKFGDEGLVTVSSILLLFTNGPLVLISLVYRCEQCYRQNENIVSILDELMAIEDVDAVTKQVLGEFLDLVKSRAITFHAANFFKINYALLVSIASACVTYTIILC